LKKRIIRRASSCSSWWQPPVLCRSCLSWN